MWQQLLQLREYLRGRQPVLQPEPSLRYKLLPCRSDMPERSMHHALRWHALLRSLLSCRQFMRGRAVLSYGAGVRQYLLCNGINMHQQPMLHRRQYGLRYTGLPTQCILRCTRGLLLRRHRNMWRYLLQWPMCERRVLWAWHSILWVDLLPYINSVLCYFTVWYSHVLPHWGYRVWQYLLPSP